MHGTGIGRKRNAAGEAGGVGKRKRWAAHAASEKRRGACQPALRFLAHVGNHLREYDLHVHERWVGVVAFAADQIVLGVQVRIVRAKVVKAGETSKDSIDGRHVWAPTTHRPWVGVGASNLVIASRSSGRDRVSALTIFSLDGDNREM